MKLVERITLVVKEIGKDIKGLKGRVLALETHHEEHAGANAVDESQVQSAVESKVTESINTLKGELATLVTPTITAEINKVVGGAPETFNTLKEIADYIEQDKTGASAMTTAVNNRLRFDEQQTLSTEQQTNVLNSLGLTEVDFVAEYNTAVNS